MRPATSLLAALAIGILVTNVVGQRPRDFSGAWTHRSAPPVRNAPATLESGWGPSFTITQRDNELIVERVFFSPGDLQPPLKFRYTLDGSESVNTVLMGRGVQRQSSTASWKGEQLVITTTYFFASPDDDSPLSSEVRQTLRLERTRRMAWPPNLVIETTRSGVLGGPMSSTRTVYSRN